MKRKDVFQVILATTVSWNGVSGVITKSVSPQRPKNKTNMSTVLCFRGCCCCLFCCLWACEDDFLSLSERDSYWGSELVTRSGCRRRPLMRFAVGVSWPPAHSLFPMALSGFMLSGVPWREKKSKGTDRALLHRPNAVKNGTSCRALLCEELCAPTDYEKSDCKHVWVDSAAFHLLCLCNNKTRPYLLMQEENSDQ